MSTAALSPKRKVWSDEELEALPKDGHKYELLDAELIRCPIHAGHGVTSARLAALVGNFVWRRRLGAMFGSTTGIRLSNELVLSPDLAFASHATLKRILVAPDKFLYGVPDLVVEVLSPSDRMVQINRKLEHYFEHGTQLAWLVNWRKAQVHIYTADSIEALTGPSDVLTGGKVLPGFKCKLSRIFGPT